MRRVWMALGALLAVLSLVLVRATLPDDALAGVTVIGGTSTLPAGGGSGGSLDAGSIDNTLLSSTLQSALVYRNDAGQVPGVVQGSSAYSSVCYGDGGLMDGAPCAAQQAVIFAGPTQFVIRDEDGGTGIRLNTPTAGDRPIGVTEFRSLTSAWDYCFSNDFTTTGASATVFRRIAFPAATNLYVEFTCTAASPDGGATVTAKYHREFISTLPDGGSTPATVGGIDTIGTDRENDSTWGGPNAVTYDGGSSTGVAELVTQGAAAQNITWNCSGCWKRTPRADAGF